LERYECGEWRHRIESAQDLSDEEAAAAGIALGETNIPPRRSSPRTRSSSRASSRERARGIEPRARTGEKIEVYFDDFTKPIMTARDTTFPSGRSGIGSFDDTGDFDEVRLRGATRSMP
jgi:hypothetical protein